MSYIDLTEFEKAVLAGSTVTIFRCRDRHDQLVFTVKIEDPKGDAVMFTASRQLGHALLLLEHALLANTNKSHERRE